MQTETIRNIGDRRDAFYSNVRGHLAARDDKSGQYAGATYGPEAVTQPYESDCSYCYLNITHTVDAHKKGRDEYRVANTPPVRA